MDLLLQLRGHVIVTEWKAVQIDFLDIKVRGDKLPDRNTKSLALGGYTLSQILKLKFGHWDKFRSKKLFKQWIKKSAAPQLRDYIRSPQVTQLVKDRNLELRAHLVVIVGSRHILLWDMDEGGKLADQPSLVGVNRW
jgi:hypothetical protein